MLIFTLLNGKTILHTGDFRATPAMESYPIFWNKDIHTVYLDTTYCNPRYDFPTQDQSLEMALYLLRQKKQEVEKAGHSFSSVLIVCGTYTIGKEKFLLGIARRVGCSVWASSEKATVISAVEGHVFNMPPPQTCQLHALPMRDLTYENNFAKETIVNQRAISEKNSSERKRVKARLIQYAMRACTGSSVWQVCCGFARPSVVNGSKRFFRGLDSFKGTFNEVVAFKPSGWENGKNSTIEKDKVTIHGIPYSEHSSFSEMVRFIKYLKPKLVVPTVDISGGVKSVQKYFPCPLVYKEDDTHQTRVTDYFSMQRQQVPAVT
ncbi:DNA cross-link repair 1A protein [Eumeta japonica]|uniref:DNA cross-link repair 1A protein n=1 Tax=Eumeta variegata TaxID=151549 RepID=A0A4C1VYT0_EUMVA|nr:DNA cross-link repair 1A protein [Eumeta japonica]